MRNKDTILLEEAYGIVRNDGDVDDKDLSGFKPPVSWDKGFQHPLELKSGEVPFQLNGKWYLYIYDKDAKGSESEVAYDYSTDMIMSYADM